MGELDLSEISITPAPANAGTRVLSTKAADCPPELIGTAWDPVMADGSAVATPMSLNEAQARFEELAKDIDTRPALRIVSFER